MTRRIVYVTQSPYKKAELDAFVQYGVLPSGARVCDEFVFDLRTLTMKEILEVDLTAMVSAEVRAAYTTVREPCIVEHAGLIFEHRLAAGYPGGLTKPMWNALGSDFVAETRSAGQRAIARAVVGYCDGTNILTFIGETSGTIAASGPRGSTPFYWDTVFEPDSGDPAVAGKTYAEILDDPTLGVRYKVVELSQSFKAMTKFLEFRQANEAQLWDSRYAP